MTSKQMTIGNEDSMNTSQFKNNNVIEKGSPWLRLAFLLPILILSLNVAASELRVGASAISISPEKGGYLAGYQRDRKSAGQHDDVFAKAVVIVDDKSAIAIVVIDCIGLLNSDVMRIRELVAKQSSFDKLRPEQIIVTSTHTHSGPDVMGLWGKHIFSNGRDEDYVTSLVEAAAAQIVNAIDNLKIATMSVGSKDADISWVENISEPGLLDNEFTTISFKNHAGRSIATLTNFPCHPTVLDGDNHLVSSDYVGGFYQAMDEKLGGTNLFLQGAIGGWVQPKQGDRSIGLAREYGSLLASISENLLKSASEVESPIIRFESVKFDIPLDNFGFRLLMFLGILERETFSGNMRTETAWFSIGPVQFATHPGETSPAYSLATRELMGNPEHSMILGLGSDALGYILKPDYFQNPDRYPKADYLTTVSVGPEAAPKLMESLETIIPKRNL